MISDEQIKWLSKEFAEKFSKPPYFTVGSQISQEEYLELQKEDKSFLVGTMVHTLTWLSSRFSLVNSELVDGIYQGILAQSDQEGDGISPYNKGRKDVLDLFFPELFTKYSKTKEETDE